jgi:membrane dipeptidase
VRFFDAHCDTVGVLLEEAGDFTASSVVHDAAGADGAAAGPAADRPVDRAAGAVAEGPGRRLPHVTLPGLKTGRIGVQVFASWAWSGKYKGREYDAAMEKVEAVRRLCADFPDDLVLASFGEDLAIPFAPGGPETARVAVLPSLEGADPLAGDVDNLFAFYEAGVRLLTLAWGDNPFCGSTYGEGAGLSSKGCELVAACESLGVMVDVSHLSDRGFADLCRVAERPFVASHSNCRAICPSGRNLTDDMIRALAERGGVMGITLAPGFLSTEYYERERAVLGDSFQSVLSGEETFEEAQARGTATMAAIPRPPLASLLAHVERAINVGGEDSVGLGGDLDGVDFLPTGFTGVSHYPRIEELLRAGGLPPHQVEKVCYGNFLRVFQEVLG